ncbi:MAG TPA: hypothetical protein PLD84_09365 [Chitinophagales bacterium]|nr:hypothetical protein [Chitinophagales bacterium]
MKNHLVLLVSMLLLSVVAGNAAGKIPASVISSRIIYDCFNNGLQNTAATSTSALQPGISNSINEVIVTDSHKELNRRVWTFSTSDIFYRKGFTSYDVTQEEYVHTVQGLHPYAVAFSEGKTSDWARQIIGDTLIFGGRGNGFNIPSWVPTTILQGMSTQKFYINGKSYDFFNAYVKLIHEIPARGYVLGNIMTGTCAEVIWMIRRANPEYVQLGLEQMRAEAYSEYWKKNPSNYKLKFNRWADSIRAVFPKVKIIADVPPSHSNIASDQAWIKELQTGLKADAVRDYWHLHWMSQGKFTGDIRKDEAIMNSIFTTTIPSLIDKNKKLFPGKELVIDQWSVSLTGDGGRNPYKRTFFGTSYIPRMVQFMIEYNRDNNNVIASAKYENLKQLIGNKGLTSMEYEATRIMAHLFSEPATVLKIANQLEGVKIFGVKTGTTYKLIIFNDSEKDVPLPPQINCDGKMLNARVKESLSSPELNSSVWTSSAAQQQSKPYSITYMELN